MYTCDYGLIRARSSGRVMQEDVSDYTVHDLYNTYDQAYLILTHSVTTLTYSLDLHSVEDAVFQLSPDVTVMQWLTELGNGALPVADEIPEIKSGAVRYNDVWTAGYEVQAVHPTGGEGGAYTDSELRDLRLTRPGTDYTQFFKNCLVTVSGLLHLVDQDANGVLVKDGGRSAYLSCNNDIGLLSFREIGELTCIPLADTMVAARSDVGYREGIYVKFDEPIGNRTVLLSLGGYLHVDNQHYRVVNDTTILIEWWTLDIARRYSESRKLIDLSALSTLINTNPSHPGAIDLDLLDSNAAILTYLTLPQSFAILVDTDNLYVEKHVLEDSGLPGRYYAYTRPTLPMVTSNGFLPAYTAIPEKIAFTLALPNNLVRTYTAERTDQPDQYQNSARCTQDAKHYGSAYLLELGTDYL